MKHLLRESTPQERERRAIASVWEDVAGWIGASAQAHARGLESVVRAADVTIAASPIGERLRAWVDERDPASLSLWLRLVAAHRRRPARG